MLVGGVIHVVVWAKAGNPCPWRERYDVRAKLGDIRKYRADEADDVA
jgi:hypothetical protein